jgi:hypothetical protein
MIATYKMTAGIRSGAGWRCDSCDDLGFWADTSRPFSQQWNHLYDCYPMAVSTCGAQNAWQTAPVVFEPGKVLALGHRLGFDIDFIIRQDLKYHGSVFSAKSNPLPEPWLDRLRQYANDLGYRFVLHQARCSARAARGSTFEFTAWIENVGVAPIYYRYPFAIRLTQGQRQTVFCSAVDITRWLPGDAWLDERVPIPAAFAAGSAQVSCALIDPRHRRPAVRFASEGADADGWFPLDTIEIAAAD